MKIIASIIGWLLIVSGSVWALQGMSLLPGRLMAGHREWIFYGGLAIAGGAAIITWGRWRGKAGG